LAHPTNGQRPRSAFCLGCENETWSWNESGTASESDDDDEATQNVSSIENGSACDAAVPYKSFYRQRG
jgi:hypothetical protein